MVLPYIPVTARICSICVHSLAMISLLHKKGKEAEGDQAALDATLERLKAAGISYEQRDGGVLVRDPSENAILLKA
jgi:hypothetical protein